MTEKPELTFDRINVGSVYAERCYTVDAEEIATYCRLVGAQSRTHRLTDGSPDTLVAPFTFLIMWTPPRICVDQWTIPVGGIHVGQEWISHALVKAGDVVTLRVAVSDKFERKQRRVVVFESRFSDQTAQPVAEGRMTILWPR